MKIVLLALLAGFYPSHAEKLLLMPMHADSVSERDIGTIEDLFAEKLQQFTGADVVRPPDSIAACSEKPCAVAAAQSLGADQVVFGAIRRLGRQMYFSSGISKRDGGGFFQQRLTIQNVEDFELATGRMAEALAKRKSLEEVASVENITEAEEAGPHAQNRRRSFYLTGVSLGYLWPSDGSFSRWNSETSTDCSNGFGCPETERFQKYNQVFKLGWNNWFEFKPQLAMEIDLLLFAPIAIGADANMIYFFNRQDFSPFAGGGLGIHYVFADEGSHKDLDKANSGPAMNVQGGMIFFRTYNINLVVRGQYHYIGNDDKDNGASIDIGIRTKMGAAGGDKYHRVSATTWLGGGVALAYVIAMIVAASSSD